MTETIGILLGKVLVGVLSGNAGNKNRPEEIEVKLQYVKRDRRSKCRKGGTLEWRTR